MATTKKELFTTNSIAANLLEKFDKFRKQANNSTQTTQTTQTPTSTPITNNNNSSLNISLVYHKKINDDLINNDNENENLNDDCVISVNNLNNIIENQFTDDQSKKSQTNNEQTETVTQVQTTSPKTTTTTKLSSVIDDLLSTNDNDDSTVNSVKRKILTKKKSLELSFENIKLLKNRSNSSLNSTTNTNQLTNSKQQNDKLISSISEYSILQKSTPHKEVINDNKDKSCGEIEEEVKDNNLNDDLLSLSNKTLDKNEPNEQSNIDISKLFPDIENEFDNNYNIEKNKTINIDNKINNYKYLIIIISIIIYFLNISSFFNGLFTGILITSVISYIYFKLNYKSNENFENNSQNIELINQHKLFVVEKSDKNFFGVYKGWMNELREKYNPTTYFLNKTKPVYISLDYDKLRIQTTSSDIPKRTIINEILPKVKFIEQRIYDLRDCEVSLLPNELVRKRYWSKKYPICLKNVRLLNKSLSIDSIDNNNLSSNVIEHKINDGEKLLPDTQLILIARSDREKEEWFNLFKKASKGELPSSFDYMKSSSTTSNLTNNVTLATSTSTNTIGTSFNKKTDNLLFSYDASNDSVSLKNMNEINNKLNNDLIIANYEKTLKFLNAFLLRSFADFFSHKQWIEKIKTKIQKKIKTINLPYFIEEITIIDIDLGVTIPIIKNTNEPFDNEKGLWAHLDIDYNGGFKMSLATKLNLMSLKKIKLQIDQTNNLNTEINVNKSKSQQQQHRKRHLGMLNSDEEDSPEESSGDENTFNEDEKNESVNKSKKFMNIVNKITASSYFQKATENKFIKMAMENLSNTQLLLTVEVKRINGTLALNIPPHPSDRLWYGFINNPIINISATPQVGEKEVSYSAVTDWLADRLKLEFQKVLVFPNMDDIYIPLLKSEVNL